MGSSGGDGRQGSSCRDAEADPPAHHQRGTVGKVASPEVSIHARAKWTLNIFINRDFLTRGCVVVTGLTLITNFK